MHLSVKKIVVLLFVMVCFFLMSCIKEADADQFVGTYTSNTEPENLITKIDAQGIKMDFDNGEAIIIGQVNKTSIVINKQDLDNNDLVKGSGNLKGKILNLQIVELNSLDKEEDVYNIIYVKE